MVFEILRLENIVGSIDDSRFIKAAGMMGKLYPEEYDSNRVIGAVNSGDYISVLDALGQFRVKMEGEMTMLDSINKEFETRSLGFPPHYSQAVQVSPLSLIMSKIDRVLYVNDKMMEYAGMKAFPRRTEMVQENLLG